MSIYDSITVHCMIRNEENWLWFALQASLPFCKRILLWDTASEDRTLEIIQQTKSPKIAFRQAGPADPERLTDLRNEMIAETTTEWFAIIDGDEVWPAAVWVQLWQHIVDPGAEVIVIPEHCPFPRLGYFHSINDDTFCIAGVIGSYSAKVFRRHDGMHWTGAHGEALCHANGTILTRGHYTGMRVLDTAYWHMTLLDRSDRDSGTTGRFSKLHIDDPTQVPLTRIESWSGAPGVLFHERPPQVINPFLVQSPLLRNIAPLPHPSLALL